MNAEQFMQAYALRAAARHDANRCAPIIGIGGTGKSIAREAIAAWDELQRILHEPHCVDLVADGVDSYSVTVRDRMDRCLWECCGASHERATTQFRKWKRYIDNPEKP